MDIYEKLVALGLILFFVTFSIICILILTFATKNTLNKKKEVSFREKFIIIFSSIYFGISFISMILFSVFNLVVTILIFLHLVFIVLVSNIKKKGGLLLYVLIFDTILGMYICICNLFNLDFNFICWYIIAIGIYIIPGLAFFESKKAILKKIKICTVETEAKVIKIIKSTEDSYGTSSGATLYIPILEINYKGKNYTYMDSSNVYYYTKKAAESIKNVFINPNNPNLDSMFGSDDVLIPSKDFKNLKSTKSAVIAFYVSTFVIVLLSIFSINSQ